MCESKQWVENTTSTLYKNQVFVTESITVSKQMPVEKMQGDSSPGIKPGSKVATVSPTKQPKVCLVNVFKTTESRFVSWHAWLADFNINMEMHIIFKPIWNSNTCEI